MKYYLNEEERKKLFDFLIESGVERKKAKRMNDDDLTVAYDIIKKQLGKGD